MHTVRLAHSRTKYPLEYYNSLWIAQSMQEEKSKSNARVSPQTTQSAFNFEARWDISIMYSLMFALPLYLIETSLFKRLLVSSFSFLAKNCWMSSMNFLALLSSVKESQNASGIERFIIITLIRLELPFFYFSLISIFFSSNGFVLPKRYVQIHTNQGQYLQYLSKLWSLYHLT